jgi:ferredoxin
MANDMKVLVDWGLCDGHGVCASEAPEVFELDDDDNLLLLREEVSGDLLPKVEAAVRACPKRALTLEVAPVDQPPGT